MAKKISLAERYSAQRGDEYTPQQFCILGLRPVKNNENRLMVMLKDHKSGNMFAEFIFSNSRVATKISNLLAEMQEDESFREVPIVELRHKLVLSDNRTYHNLDAVVHNPGNTVVIKKSLKKKETSNDSSIVAHQQSSEEDEAERMFV